MARAAEKQASQPRAEQQALQEMIAKAVHEHAMRNPPKVHIPSILPVARLHLTIIIVHAFSGAWVYFFN
jgi:hypothetical protein